MSDITFDLAVAEWPGSKRVIYQAATGSHPMYAVLLIQQALEAAQAESEAYTGQDEDWIPPSLFNLPERELAGFAWMAARTREPGLRYDAYADALDFGDAVAALLMTLAERMETKDAPLATAADSGAETSSTDPTSDPASPAQSSTAGRRRSAASSPSATSKPPTRRRKPTSTP